MPMLIGEAKQNLQAAGMGQVMESSFSY